MKRRIVVATPLLLAGAIAVERWKCLVNPGAVPAASAPDMATNLVRVAGTAFGTTVCLAALAPRGDHRGEHARASLRRAMQEVQRIDALMSLFRPDSQLSILNRTGSLAGAHPHVLRNLEFAQHLARLTEGAFDATVQPLWELFDRESRDGRLPGHAALARARALVDYRQLRIDGDSVSVQRAGVKITLNSLAQGYAVDVVLDILRRAGLEAALIDTGEIGSLGVRDATHPWTVGVQHPRDRERLVALVAMDGRVISTSGDYATTFTPDFRYHHIFDPATGVSAPGLSSTVVLARSGLVADGISTALMVLGRARGAALLSAFPGIDALWLDKQARLDHTPGVPFTS